MTRTPTAVGTPVHVDYRKWVDARSGSTTEHWQQRVHWLGTDEYGSWLALPTGTVSAKPTNRMTMAYPHVKLITEHGWAGNICRPPEGRRVVVYVDMITVPEWTRTDDGYRVTMIDLDLDVIAWNDGTIMVDDEDEFADHQVRMHYPAEAIGLARSACTAVEQLLRAGAEPFRTVADRWLSRVD